MVDLGPWPISIEVVTFVTGIMSGFIKAFEARKNLLIDFYFAGSTRNCVFVASLFMLTWFLMVYTKPTILNLCILGSNRQK